jgi:YD repeat-containing protein
LLNTSYNYTLNTAGNNGNIMQISDARDGNRTMTFGYDALNRLTSGISANTDCTTVGNGITRNWGQSFTYDA